LTDASFTRVPGGKGANQAAAASRLGADVRFVGRVGVDTFTLEALEREGVDARFVTRDASESGVALILVAEDGENLIVVAPGANRRLRDGDVSRAFEGKQADAVICQQEIPLEAVLAAQKGARQSRAFLCFNAAPARGPLDPRLKPDLLVANRYEYAAIGSYDGLVVLTLGAEGAVLMEAGEEIARARPPRVRAVDGTAAGDAFCAALVVSLVEGCAQDQALVRACAAGALAASRAGAQPSLPTRDELAGLIAA
jgi:ribokinase